MIGAVPVEAVHESAIVVPIAVAVRPVGTLGTEIEDPAPESATLLTVPPVVRFIVPL